MTLHSFSLVRHSINDISVPGIGQVTYIPALLSLEFEMLLSFRSPPESQENISLEITITSQLSELE
jgi:hypothetical protein